MREPGEWGRSAALEALYHAAGGSNWTNSSNWLDDAAPLGEWHGVSTAGQGRVTTLDLRENGLTGTVPDALGDLASLTTLDLRENGLTGTVPAALADLASLEELLLSKNALSGPIPTALGNLASLRRLVLARNFLAGPIPHGLGRLSRLEELGLNDNELSGPIPIALGALVRLEELDLGGNALSGSIPGELESLQRLESLYVWGNPLTGPLPRRLTRLGSLAALEMHDTQLCVPNDAEFRDWVGSIADFTGRFCDAAGTPFTGPTPMSGAGPVQAVHLTELREYADSLRLRCGLELFRWTDAVIVRGVTPVRAVHVNDLRHALTEAFEVCEATPRPWSDPAPAPGAPVRAGHFAELREAVVAGPTTGGLRSVHRRVAAPRCQRLAGDLDDHRRRNRRRRERTHLHRAYEEGRLAGSPGRGQRGRGRQPVGLRAGGRAVVRGHLRMAPARPEVQAGRENALPRARSAHQEGAAGSLGSAIRREGRLHGEHARAHRPAGTAPGALEHRVRGLAVKAHPPSHSRMRSTSSPGARSASSRRWACS